MNTNILIRAPDGSDVVLDETDLRALHSYHMHHAATARSDEDYAYHQTRAEYLDRCLRSAVDHTETAA